MITNELKDMQKEVIEPGFQHMDWSPHLHARPTPRGTSQMRVTVATESMASCQFQDSPIEASSDTGRRMALPSEINNDSVD